MCEFMIENDIARWEMRRLEREAPELYRVRRLKGEVSERLIVRLAAFGSHILLNLGNALIAASERLRVREKSSTAASA